MRETLAMWRRPRMIGLAVLVALAYALLLIPFKRLTLVPGIASVRPAGALPFVFGLLFGPAAAWGSMVGNAVGDVVGGTWSAASPFGAVANFFFGYLGYHLWGNLGRLSSGDPPDMHRGEQFVEFLAVVVVTAALVAAIIGWGADLVGLFPFSALSTTVFVNNVIAGVIIGPPLLYVLYPRVAERGWLFQQILAASAVPERSERRRRRAVTVLAVVSVGWLLIGTTYSVVVDGIPFGAGPGPATFGAGGSTVQMVLGAALFVVVIVASLLSGVRVYDE